MKGKRRAAVRGRSGGVVSLTRRVMFRATHRYARADWDDMKNHAMFGRGAGPAHSHDYACYVTVSGPVDPKTGMIVPLPVLDEALQREVVRRFDGQALHELEEFGGERMPTGEELALLVRERVSSALRAVAPRVRVTEVRVAEDQTMHATWRAR